MTAASRVVLIVDNVQKIIGLIICKVHWVSMLISMIVLRRYV